MRAAAVLAHFMVMKCALVAASERRTVEVYADWRELDGAKRMGLLCATPVRGKEIFSFEFDAEWLALSRTRALDPALRLGPGPQYVTAGRENFGLFLDSSPDRWGRVLMQRREAQQAREHYPALSRNAWRRLFV
jgi:serine/threonine-protein kinase HipA